MTPKEKAKDLYQMYYECLWHQDEQSRIQNAKQGALIAVDEVLKTRMFGVEFFYYWDNVKIEIEKL